MSNLLKSDDFGLKLYNRFPMKYREDDESQNLALKRYLQSMGEGGFQYAIDDINGLTTLIDPDNIKAEHLPLLFRHYGLEVFNGIPEEYLRYLLPRLGEIYSIKGSLQAVEYVCTSISGIKTETEIFFNEDGNPVIKIKLEMDLALGDYIPNMMQLLRILKKFIPFYCDIIIFFYYVFSDSSQIYVKENFIDNVTRTERLENGLLYYGGERVSYSSHLYSPKDIESSDSSLLLNNFMLNGGKSTYMNIDVDYTTNKINLVTPVESGGIKLLQDLSGTSSVFGDALFGNAVFNRSDKKVGESDEIIDIIKIACMYDAKKIKLSGFSVDNVTRTEKLESGLLYRGGERVTYSSHLFSISDIGSSDSSLLLNRGFVLNGKKYTDKGIDYTTNKITIITSENCELHSKEITTYTAHKYDQNESFAVKGKEELVVDKRAFGTKDSIELETGGSFKDIFNNTNEESTGLYTGGSSLFMLNSATCKLNSSAYFGIPNCCDVIRKDGVEEVIYMI